MHSFNSHLTVFMLLMFFYPLSQISAQQTAASTGGVSTGAGGFSSYSLGQTVYSYYSGGSASITEGVQQVYATGVSPVCLIIRSSDALNTAF